jgi:hypothetical protein
MFKGIVNWFKGEGVREMVPGGTNTGENTMTAKIAPTSDGKFVLFTRGETVGTYSRKRDAVRGANRRGLTIA